MSASHPVFPDVVSIKGLYHAYGSEQVLRGVDLSIQPGEFIFLTGRTGSGKSTLLRILNAELPAYAEKAFVADFDLLGLKPKDRYRYRRQLGVVFQDFKLLDDRSVFENMRFVLRATDWRKRKKIKARIHEVLDAVGLAAKADRRPEQLSGGEQQKASIARALLNHPRLIIADEPTGNLDPETSLEILSLLESLAQKNGAAVIFATHDMTLPDKVPDRTMLRCDNGKIDIVI